METNKFYYSSNDNQNYDLIMADLKYIEEIQNDIKVVLEKDKENLNKIEDNISSTDFKLKDSLKNIQESKKSNLKYKSSLMLGTIGFVLLGPIGGIITGINTGLISGVASGLVAGYIGNNLI